MRRLNYPFSDDPEERLEQIENRCSGGVLTPSHGIKYPSVCFNGSYYTYLPEGEWVRKVNHGIISIPMVELAHLVTAILDDRVEVLITDGFLTEVLYLLRSPKQ
jgi:hypothetical protein